MEDWLAELEVAWNEDPIVNNKVNEQEQCYQQNEDIIINTLDEELAAVLGDDFYFNNNNLISPQNNISSLLTNCTLENPTNISFQSILIDQQIPQFSNNIVPNINKNNNDYSPTIEPLLMVNEQQVINHQSPNNNNNGDKIISNISNDENAKIRVKRKRRDPEQVHGHIMAERKRRELLTQRFIALSAMVPGLKKVDKTSILGEAIKHLQKMQEKVKMLEEATANQVVGSTMVVKRTQLIITDKNNENVNCLSSSSGGSEGDQNDTLPEIEVKVTRKTILLSICCVKRKGILAKIYEQVENHGMTLLNTSVMPFESSALNITILAQMEGRKEDDKKVEDLLRSLHYLLRLL